MRRIETEADVLRAIEDETLPLFEPFEDEEIPVPVVKHRRTSSESIVSPARFIEMSSNRKLSPVDSFNLGTNRAALVPRAPFCCSTYASIEATCSSSCPFKESGCYAKAGYTAFVNRRMDDAARGRSALEVAVEEAKLIDSAFGGGPVPLDGARGGRDMRLHVGGDVLTSEGAATLAAAVDRFRRRGGGTAWTYTHSWREVDRSAWGRITTLASTEVASDIEEARSRGYAAAIVVERFPNKHRVFSLAGSSARVVPCPAQVGRVTCVECRLCLDADLLGKDLAIGFSVHGVASSAVRRSLRVLNNVPEPQMRLF